MLRGIVDQLSNAGVVNGSSGDGHMLEAFLQQVVSSRDEAKVTAPAKPGKRGSILGALFGGGNSKESRTNETSVDATANAMIKPETVTQRDSEHGTANRTNGEEYAIRNSENMVAETKKAEKESNDELDTVRYALAPENEPSFLARSGLDRHEEITEKLLDLGMVSAEDLASALGSGALDLSMNCGCTPDEEEAIALALDALDQSLDGRLSSVINAGAPPKRVSLLVSPPATPSTTRTSVTKIFGGNSNKLTVAEMQKAKDEKAAAAEEARLAKEKERQHKEEEKRALAERKAEEKKEREARLQAEKAEKEAAALRAKDEARRKKEEQKRILAEKKKAEEEAKKAKAQSHALQQKTDLQCPSEHGDAPIESSIAMVGPSPSKVEVPTVPQVAAAKKQSQIEAFGRAALQRQKGEKPSTDKDASVSSKDEKLEAVFNERLAAEEAQVKTTLPRIGAQRSEMPSGVRERGQLNRLSLEPGRGNPATTGGGKGSGRGSANRASIASPSDQARGVSISRAPKRPSVMSGRGAGRASIAGAHSPSAIEKSAPSDAPDSSNTAVRTIRERSPPRSPLSGASERIQGNDRVSGVSPPRALRPAPRKSTRSPPRPSADDDERIQGNDRVSGVSPPRALRPAPRKSTRSPPRPSAAD